MQRSVFQRVLQECLAQGSQKVSKRRVLPCSFTGESPLQSLQQRLTEVSFEDASQECLTRVSDKSVSEVCPQRASYKSVQQEWLAEVSFEGSPRVFVNEFARSKFIRLCYMVRTCSPPMDCINRRPRSSLVPEAVQWVGLEQAEGEPFQLHFVEDFVYDTVLHSIPEFLQYQQDFLQTDVSKGCINSFMLNNLILETESLDPFARRLDELSVPYFVFAIDDRPDYAAFILEFREQIVVKSIQIMCLPSEFNHDIHAIIHRNHLYEFSVGFCLRLVFLNMSICDRYALLFSFPGNEGVTLQLQSPHLSYVAPRPVEFCK